MTAVQPIRVGIIGTGFARSTQVPAFQACPGVEVVSIASAHLERAEALAKDRGIPHIARDWREVVGNPQVDLVSIVTPPHLHHEMALAAVHAGKAVLCEKPTAMDAAQAEIMFLAAEQRGVLALLDHELRFLDSRQRMRELILEGALGTVHHARVRYRSDNRAGPGAHVGLVVGRDAGRRPAGRAGLARGGCAALRAEPRADGGARGAGYPHRHPAGRGDGRAPGGHVR